MIPLLTFLFLTGMQWLAGFGLLTLLHIRLSFLKQVSIALLTGLGISSTIPFALQLFYVPITELSIGLTLILLTGLLNLQFTKGWNQLLSSRREWDGRIRWYNVPALLVIAALALISLWRCFYFPPTPRDLTSGAEVVAEYTVREKTMINSVFEVNLESTNNPFKPAFITSLQVIYKYAGFPFGQIWLSVLFVSFLVFIYGTLTERLHRMLAALLIIFFLAIPEMYAYSFMALFDFPNAVYFCLALFFLFRYFHSKALNELLFASFLFALSTYVRAETLLLLGLLLPAFLMHYKKRPSRWKHILPALFIVFFPAALVYYLSVDFYIAHYLPVNYDVENLLRADWYNPAPFFERFWAMNDQLIFSDTGVDYYGYFFFLFIGLLLVDAIWRESWNAYSLNWLYGVLVIYFGLPFIAHLFPLFDLHHSTKRGLFKIFPLMLMYMGHSRVMQYLSERIGKWEIC